ncbi:mannose-1-phosphate guanylyltransferase/mannose-6-phosphate isomerase [Sphingobium sp. OAS761]|uniref:mannose-1-phosphate guanylyltransferase/mannose-6-phosphate isomerase n=1 Tax=Sphingobium sp. OAS761 TaxID=2817901 RepID=UPI00209CA203|nr:mannose-1-phosphate guanylyltransferase/mannose-6-phosphate isomerase [Sphingobium sp. OAS761]
MSTSSSLYPVILSGGSGTRLWPLSRPECPKQFIPLVTDRSMMQETILRASGLAGLAPALVVSSANHVSLIVEQLAAIDHDPSAILLEPEGRNTAPAIALAAQWIAKRDRDALMLVMPSDHVIADVPSFHRAVAAAMPAARSGRLVTFGIQPHYAETGYGYIAKGSALDAAESVFSVAQFVEKPPRERAEAFLKGGVHYWNGGIFLFNAGVFLDELAAHAPEVASAAQKALSGARHVGDQVLPDAAAFCASPDISIDVAVMERTGRAAVVPVDMGWSDVGSWDALWAIRDRDSSGNSEKGAVINVDGAGNLIYVDGGPPVAAVGLTNSVVVSTAQGVLIMPRDRAQDVKAVVDLVKKGALD